MTQGPPARPLLVLGSPRSGTTLVGNYLGSSASVLNLVEYGGFYLSYATVPRECAQMPSPYKPASAWSELKTAVRRFDIDTDSLDETQLAVSHATLEPRPAIGQRTDDGRVVLVPGHRRDDGWPPEAEAEVWPVVAAVHRQLAQSFPGVLGDGPGFPVTATTG